MLWSIFSHRARATFKKCMYSGMNYKALVNAKSLYLLDVEKYISKNVQSEELKSKGWYGKTKENRIACWCDSSDNNREDMVNIGYMVANYDLGPVF